MKNSWHYPRTDLAKQIIGMFDTGLANSLVFFAPRRMGKTEFLCKDIQPLAQKLGWQTFYFSFLDAGVQIKEEFRGDIYRFAEEVGAIPAKKLSRRINKVGGEVLGIRADIELRDPQRSDLKIKEIIKQLAKKGKTLLLMDEVQVLANDRDNEQFIAALRTALDINKDAVKVIFTGSSQEGLRQMFSQAKAPFFHFGQNLPFPELGQDFTDHLVKAFEKATQRTLDREYLWQVFVEMGKVPQLIRSLVERLALNPDLSMDAAKKQLLTQVYDDRAFVNIWRECSALEKLVLLEIVKDGTSLFAVVTRAQLAKTLGIDALAPTTIQAAIRALLRKMLIGRLEERGCYYIADPNFKNWLIEL
jgi:hypothetical protein